MSDSAHKLDDEFVTCMFSNKRHTNMRNLLFQPGAMEKSVISLPVCVT